MDENKINGSEPAEDEEHGDGMSLLDFMSVITGQRPVMVRHGVPFVVVQMIPNPDAPCAGYGLDISAGCLPNLETVAAIVLDTLVQMNGLSREDEEALIRLVEERRTAKGLRSMTDHAFKEDEEPAAEPEPAKN